MNSGFSGCFGFAWRVGTFLTVGGVLGFRVVLREARGFACGGTGFGGGDGVAFVGRGFGGVEGKRVGQAFGLCPLTPTPLPL